MTATTDPTPATCLDCGSPDVVLRYGWTEWLCRHCADRRRKDCETCRRYAGEMQPNHFASPRCESGWYAHCTCDICF